MQIPPSRALNRYLTNRPGPPRVRWRSLGGIPSPYASAAARCRPRRSRHGQRSRDPPPDHRTGHGRIGRHRRFRGPRPDPAHRGRLSDARPADAGHQGGGAGRDRCLRGARGPRRDVRRATRWAARKAARGSGQPRDPVRQARLADPDLRGRVGQGWGRQVLRHGQPGRGDGRRRSLCRRARRDVYGFSVPRMLGVDRPRPGWTT